METAATHTEGFIQARQPWLRNAGIFSLFLYAFFWLLDIEISRIGESLMFLFFVIMLFTNKPKFLLREPIPYLLLGWIIFQVAMYQWAVARFPELATDHINEARTITNIFMFLVVAWWLGGNTKHVVSVFVLCAIGYLIGATFQDGGLLDTISEFKKHKRMDFGYQNAQHTAVYSTFIFLSLICFKSRILSLVSKKNSWLAKTLIYIAITYAVIAIIVSGARATWFGLIILASIFLPILITRKIIKHRKQKTKKPERKLFKREIFWLATIASVILITLAAYNTQIIISQRLNAESDVINKLLKGDTKNLRLSSISLRIDSWKKAIDWIKKRPITGWGAQSRKALLLKSNWSPWLKKRFRHLHNSYLEILVSYGLVGFTLFAGLFFYIWYNTWEAWKARRIPNDVVLFAGLWSIYWLIVNFFESYVIYSSTGNYINAISAGMLYTYHLMHKQQKTITKTSY